ncbi:MAG: MBL fold metallo-hydrolase [Pseudomonadales bacterium]|jgi:glyoxylase-like metal-dependent hydrolase (beta-lactamase superfamily II)|nr:MBL fold metallo-hydrolase [Pseudomonadales bacterium]MDP6471822.1 MBL fold metallo-hydrolase [Pseudomonadales bacterium]MDP6828764.1 MBL fold metallo-hydrolase [Pseudomonadales bacterium]MDP6970303.1 MBL fold metallo-hydrolase [Pseudomonadales bacterium]|tara:strand:- start:223 stop:909 length:687 start_codon:yes stop_codon:yes gene_type:complete
MTYEQEPELIVEQIPIGPMQNFTYIVGSRTTREVAVVDPAWDVEGLVNHINEQGYKLTAALVTHYHPDHIGGDIASNNIAGLADLMSVNPVKAYTHQHEADGVRKVSGLSDSDLVKVASGDKLSIGEIEVEFLHTPGHTPGSQCFKIRNTLVSGDTLFIDGCGRVDLAGSDTEEMYHSLQKLKGLPDDTLLLPGHNYSSVPNATMGECKTQNVYLNIKDLETWHSIMG